MKNIDVNFIRKMGKPPEDYKIKWYKSIVPRLFGKLRFRDETIEIYDYKDSYWVKFYE